MVKAADIEISHQEVGYLKKSNLGFFPDIVNICHMLSWQYSKNSDPFPNCKFPSGRFATPGSYEASMVNHAQRQMAIWDWRRFIYYNHGGRVINLITTALYMYS